MIDDSGTTQGLQAIEAPREIVPGFDVGRAAFVDEARDGLNERVVVVNLRDVARLPRVERGSAEGQAGSAGDAARAQVLRHGDELAERMASLPQVARATAHEGRVARPERFLDAPRSLGRYEEDGGPARDHKAALRERADLVFLLPAHDERDVKDLDHDDSHTPDGGRAA